MRRLRRHLGAVFFACTTAAVLATGRLYLLLPALLVSLAWVAATESTRVSVTALVVALLAPLPFVDVVDRAALLAMVSSLTWGVAAGLRWRRLQAEREARSRLEVETYRAVTEERLRIARDLHDLVAHGLTAMTVQAGYGALAVEADADARMRFRAIEESGRETLGQVRQLLRVLRSDDAPLRPAPRLADLEALVSATERAGLPVEVDVAVADSAVTPEIAGCVYHVVQEGLTNALKHSRAASVRVSVGQQGGELVAAVTDAGSTSHQPPDRDSDRDRPGLGLVGLRERVEACGGRLDAGAHGSGYRLEMRLPPSAAVESV